MKTTSLRLFDMNKNSVNIKINNEDIIYENDSENSRSDTPRSDNNNINNNNSNKVSPKNKKNVAETVIETTSVINSIADGFNDIVMQSVNQSESIKDPEADSKYKQFLEILFGKNSKDYPSNALNTIKRRLLNELRSRKLSMASHGVVIKGINTPVTNVIEKYRDDRDYSPDFDESIEQRAKMVLKKQQDIIEFECKYNSRKYKPIINNILDEDDEDDDKNSFRDDLMDNDNIINKNTSKDTDQGEEIPDSEIDPAANNKNENNNNNGKSKFNIISSPYDALKSDHGSAMNTVNKVVFKILEDYIKDEDNEMNLVDVEQEMPGLDLSGINENGNQKPKIIGPRKPFNHLKTKKYFKKKDLNDPNFLRSNIIPDQKEITPSMLKSIKEEDVFSRLIFDNGKTKNIKSSLYKPTIPKTIKNNNFKISNNYENIKTFPLENQVVSFGGGKRSIGNQSINFTNVRINQSKYHGLTRPITSISNSKPFQNKRPSSPLKISLEQKNLKFIIGDLVRLMLETDNEELKHFDTFYRKIRMIKHRPSSSSTNATLNNNKIEIEFQEIYPKIQSLYVKHIKQRNTEETSNELIKISNEKPNFTLLLQKEIEKTLNEQKQFNLIQNKRKIINSNSVFKPEMAINHLDLSWIKENPNYNAVAVHFSNNNNKFDAIIKPTNKIEKDLKFIKNNKNFKNLINQINYNDLLNEFDLNELILITSNIIPKKVINEIINQFN